MDTTHTNNDGTYIMLNIQSIQFYDEYLVSNNDKIENVIVIVIENGLPVEENVKLVEDVLYLLALDQKGNELSLGDIYTQSSTKFSEIIFSAMKPLETAEIKYIIIGGLNFESNKFSKIIFRIN